MDNDCSGHGPQCMICHKFFTPDPRQGDRQRCCGASRCRQQYKNLWSRQERKRKPAEVRAAVKQRVALHRKRRKQSAKGPPDRELRMAEQLSCVVESMVNLEATVNGLAARTTAVDDRERLHEVLANCAAEGRKILAISSEKPP